MRLGFKRPFVNKILSNDLRTKKHFFDVFVLDEFKRYFSELNRYIDGICVCNGEKSKQIGRHWFLIFIRNGTIFFIDSFAKHPQFYTLDTCFKNFHLVC